MTDDRHTPPRIFLDWSNGFPPFAGGHITSAFNEPHDNREWARKYETAYVRADLADAVVERLRWSTKLMAAERDLLVESSTKPDGTYMDDSDAQAVADMQAEIDANNAAIAAMDESAAAPRERKAFACPNCDRVHTVEHDTFKRCHYCGWSEG